MGRAQGGDSTVGLYWTMINGNVIGRKKRVKYKVRAT